jgi:molybdate transport system substrate-binding protein
MNRTIATILSLATLLGVCIWLLLRADRPSPLGKSPLVVHCAAGLRIPVSEIAREYEREFGVPVHLQFGGSGALESQLAVAGGDLYLPVDDSYIRSTRSKGLVRESIPVASLTAGIVVPKGNPKELHSLGDLGKNGIRLSLADRSAAIGKLTWHVLEQSAALPRLEANVLVTKPTVNNIVEDVATGAVDATIAWDAVTRSFPELEWIAVPEFSAASRAASIGVLASATDPARALHFARFLSSRDRGLPVFGKAGFQVAAPADHWAEAPEITFFSGSMLRPAIQERLQQFEQREGCRISTVFEGCGTLVAMMKDGGGKPAAYFSCDTKFLDMVEDRFGPRTVVSGNEIIMLVPKGNPKKLRTLDDLLQSGLKIGQCDPAKSALGYLTRHMITRHGLAAELDASGNVVMLSGKGDDLVNAMQARSLDVVLVYRSNALASPPIRESCEIIGLNDPLALATQPFAVARDTEHPQLMTRLGAWLSDPSARPRFEELGFTWKLGDAEE